MSWRWGNVLALGYLRGGELCDAGGHVGVQFGGALGPFWGALWGHLGELWANLGATEMAFIIVVLVLLFVLLSFFRAFCPHAPSLFSFLLSFPFPFASFLCCFLLSSFSSSSAFLIFLLFLFFPLAPMPIWFIFLMALLFAWPPKMSIVVNFVTRIPLHNSDRFC